MISTFIYTIGYEGRNLDDFTRSLRRHRIDEVIDVRELPVSRKKGFSKTKLSQSLEDAGFKYKSVPSLGSPRDLRQRYRATQDWSLFMQEYLQVLREHQPELQELLQKTYQERVCLLCFEHESSKCHRSLIADELRELSGREVSIVNL